MTFQGCAVKEDNGAMKRNQISRLIQKRMSLNAAKEIVESLLKAAFEAVTKPNIARKSSEALKLEDKNPDFCLVFTPGLIAQLTDFATRAYQKMGINEKGWDYSVDGLYITIQDASTDLKSGLLSEFNSILEKSRNQSKESILRKLA